MNERQNLYNYALKLLGGRRYTVAGMEKKLAARVEKIYGATIAPGDYHSPGEGASNAAATSPINNDTAGSCPVTADDIASIISRLKEYKFLDDREYANLFIRDHILYKPQGIMLLKMKMAAKGLPKDIIAQAIADAGINEFTLAKKLAAKKIKALKQKPPERSASANSTIRRNSARAVPQNTHRSSPSQKKKEKLARFLISRGFGYKAISETLKAFPSDGEEDYQSP